MDWSHVDYLWITVMFLSLSLDSHSDGTHSLQRIHWWVSDVMLDFSKSVLMKKQIHPHLEWPIGKFSFLGELLFKKNNSFKHIYLIACVTILTSHMVWFYGADELTH